MRYKIFSLGKRKGANQQCLFFREALMRVEQYPVFRRTICNGRAAKKRARRNSDPDFLIGINFLIFQAHPNIAVAVRLYCLFNEFHTA